MSTPHNNANKGDIAKTVLMPGDPLRAKFIAERFLDNYTCYNTIRNMLGFTGFYKGIQISVQGSGMGVPSMGIYSYELFDYYEVENIIRVGTAGAISPNVNLRDVVIAQGVCTNSNYAFQFDLPGSFAPIASYKLLKNSAICAGKIGATYHVGNILTSDVFYDKSNNIEKWIKMNVLAVEMETAALYTNAARLNKNALCIATISDCPLRNQFTTGEEREKTFLDMMEIALETAIL